MKIISLYLLKLQRYNSLIIGIIPSYLIDATILQIIKLPVAQKNINTSIETKKYRQYSRHRPSLGFNE